MATYIVCHSGSTTTRQVANQGLTTTVTRNYTYGDCSVIENTATLKLGCFTPCDTDFTIWYSYKVSTYVNGTYQPPQLNITRTIIMPAGSISVYAPVVISMVYSCTSTVPPPPPTP